MSSDWSAIAAMSAAVQNKVGYTQSVYTQRTHSFSLLPVHY